MKPKTARKILKWILLVAGGLAATAVFPMAMPTDWMEAANGWLGLGPLPPLAADGVPHALARSRTDSRIPSSKGGDGPPPADRT